jgi:amphi-Trp domain-containing protein
MSKQEVKVKFPGELQAGIKYLEDLVSALKNGIVCVQKDQDFITLNPTKDIFLEIEAEKKKDRESLRLELSWRAVSELAASNPQITISANEPKKNIQSGKVKATDKANNTKDLSGS